MNSRRGLKNLPLNHFELCSHCALLYNYKEETVDWKISNFFKHRVFFCLSTFLILFRVVKNKSGLSYTTGKEIFVVIFGWGVIYNHKRLFFYGTWESVFISECHPNPGTQWGVGWILNLLCCSCSQVLVQVWQRHSRVCTGYITVFLLFLLSLYFLIPPLLL